MSEEAVDPHYGMDQYRRWVGGNWPEVQKWQWDFINDELMAYDKDKIFLDLGCGSLRLGARLIKTHGTGKYIGLDTNQRIIDYGLNHEINPKVLEAQKPRFIVNDNFDLSSLGDEKVHIVWAYSLWPHVNDEKLRIGLRNVREALDDHPTSAMFSTFGGAPPAANGDTEPTPDDYVYDRFQRTYWRWEEDLEEIFAECGLSFELRRDTIKGGRMYRSAKI
jgi:SAM-dependent methyltransferase